MHCRRKWQPTPVFLPGESQGRGSLVGCRLWGRMESDMAEATQQQQCLNSWLSYSWTSLWLSGKESICSAGGLGSISGSKRSLEKGMATHSSILAWRIPWTEEPSGLQSMSRPESDTTKRLSTHLHTHLHIHIFLLGYFSFVSSHFLLLYITEEFMHKWVFGKQF